MTEQPERFADRETFNYTQVEGALCVYEWMMEAREKVPAIDSWFDTLGSPGMRCCAIQAGDICDRAYRHLGALGYEFHSAYDFEFVPDVCAKLDWDALCNDNQYDGPRYNPDINAIVVALIAADMAKHSDPLRRDYQRVQLTPSEYIAACRREGERQWGYGDLVSDHPEKVTKAMEMDEAPAEFVKWLGEKYDLTPASEFA